MREIYQKLKHNTFWANRNRTTKNLGKPNENQCLRKILVCHPSRFFPNYRDRLFKGGGWIRSSNRDSSSLSFIFALKKNENESENEVQKERVNGNGIRNSNCFDSNYLR